MDALPTRVQFALSAWANDTLSRWDGDEIKEAHDLISPLRDDRVREQVLGVASELWLTPGDALKDAQVDEVTMLRLVVELYQTGWEWDADEFRDKVVGVYGTEREAYLRAVDLLKERASIQYDTVTGAGLRDLDLSDQGEVHLWITNTAPGYDTLHVEDLGHVLHALS